MLSYISKSFFFDFILQSFDEWFPILRNRCTTFLFFFRLFSSSEVLYFLFCSLGCWFLILLFILLLNCFKPFCNFWTPFTINHVVVILIQPSNNWGHCLNKYLFFFFRRWITKFKISRCWIIWITTVVSNPIKGIRLNILGIVFQDCDRSFFKTL